MKFQAGCTEQQWPSAKTFGGHKAVARPDPIPNSAVKRSLADGSGCIASARVGCRQIKNPFLHWIGFFAFSQGSAAWRKRDGDFRIEQGLFRLECLFCRAHRRITTPASGIFRKDMR